MRLQGYDYTQPGAYFITLVTYQRWELFGQILNGEMKLSAIGQIAQDEWMRSSQLRREICLNEDEFVIMPNHIHGIVWIVDLVGADGVRPIDAQAEDNLRGVNNAGGACHAPLQRPPHSLSAFIAGYKSIVTSRARHEFNMVGIWQRNYYDHIIRTEKDFTDIWHYIDGNPQRWQEDQLHPSFARKD